MEIIQICREDRLIDLANAIESDDSGYWTNKRISLALRNISSVTQKSGKWIRNITEHKCYARDDTYTITRYKCSECGTEPLAEGASDLADYALSNYCPNCGAKMESEDKE